MPGWLNVAIMEFHIAAGVLALRAGTSAVAARSREAMSGLAMSIGQASAGASQVRPETLATFLNLDHCRPITG